MKKVGIITFHYCNNYGAVLQSYALQEKLIELGCDAEIINYINPVGLRGLRFFDGDIIRNIRSLLSGRKKIQRIKRFKSFINEKLILSGEPVYESDYLNEEQLGYDIYVTGSDQTFNLLLLNDVKSGETYFLPFVKNKKKVSYGASMGEKIMQLTQENKEWIRGALSSYSNISVRETVAAEFINTLGLEKPKIVLDPALLLSRQQWDDVLKPVKFKKGSYILFYSVLSDSWVIDKVKKIAKQLKLDVVVPHLKNQFELFTAFKRADYCGPGEFISLINNSAFVCTTSFHCTVFSILYKKPFVSFVLGEGNRIGNLLESVDMINRAVYKNDMVNVEDMMKIDYTGVDERIERMKEESVNYLKEIIK